MWKWVHLALREAAGAEGSWGAPLAPCRVVPRKQSVTQASVFLFKGSGTGIWNFLPFRSHDTGNVLSLTSDGAFTNVHGIIVPKHLYMGSMYSCSLQYLRIHIAKEINCIGQQSVCSYSLLQSKFSALATWVTEARGPCVESSCTVSLSWHRPIRTSCHRALCADPSLCLWLS